MAQSEQDAAHDPARRDRNANPADVPETRGNWVDEVTPSRHATRPGTAAQLDCPTSTSSPSHTGRCARRDQGSGWAPRHVVVNPARGVYSATRKAHVCVEVRARAVRPCADASSKPIKVINGHDRPPRHRKELTSFSQAQAPTPSVNGWPSRWMAFARWCEPVVTAMAARLAQAEPTSRNETFSLAAQPGQPDRRGRPGW